MPYRSRFAAFAIVVVLASPAADLCAQRGGGGSTPPPDPAIVFSDAGIKVMNADGTNVVTVVSLKRGESASFPCWSPDDQQIAFCGILSGVQGIWKVNRNGSDRQLVTPHAGGFLSTSDWSRVPAPDGRTKIAFRSLGVGAFFDVFVVNDDGTGLQNLTSSPEEEDDPTWSRNATGIYTGWIDWNGTSYGARHLQLAASAGGGVEVSAAPTMLADWYFIDSNVAHTSGLLLFRGGPGPSVAMIATWVVDTHAIPWTPQMLYGPGEVLGAPSYSLDDARIVMRRQGGGQSSGIFTADANGSGLVRIRSSGTWPSWRNH